MKIIFSLYHKEASFYSHKFKIIMDLFMVKDNKIKFNQAINVISIGSASYKNLVHILKSFFGKAKD